MPGRASYRASDLHDVPFDQVPASKRVRYLQTAFLAACQESTSFLTPDQAKALLSRLSISWSEVEYVSAMGDLILEPGDYLTFERLLSLIDQLRVRREAQARAGRTIDYTARTIFVNTCIMVLFALMFALVIVYLSSSSRSSWLLGVIIGLALIFSLMIILVVLVPLVRLKMRQSSRKVHAAPDLVESRGVFVRSEGQVKLRPPQSEWSETHVPPGHALKKNSALMLALPAPV